MNNKIFLDRLDQLINEGNSLIDIAPNLKYVDPLRVNIENNVKFHIWWLSCLNLLRSQFGAKHYFYNNFRSAIGGWQKVINKDVTQPIDYCKEDLAKAYAVLVYIKTEYGLGLTADAKHLYEAELFSNLLEQAFELLEKGYIIGAAIYSRLIVENFVKDLCRVKKIKLDDKDKLPQKLDKLREAGTFDLPMERNIQSIYDVGTYATHGKDEFKQYDKDKINFNLEFIKQRILTIK